VARRTLVSGAGTRLLVERAMASSNFCRCSTRHAQQQVEFWHCLVGEYAVGVRTHLDEDARGVVAMIG
jgi:hypothetical protein